MAVLPQKGSSRTSGVCRGLFTGELMQQCMLLEAPPYGQAEEARTIARAIAILDARLRTGPLLSQPNEVRDCLRLQAQGLTYEVFFVLFLDGQNRLIAYEAMFRGTLTQTSVYPRE